ncbi:MAG TPA: adenylate/guanylate cyclase domain-containing protein [Oculatellaceae cyanobacterium]|jgi:class 3 adenylate cyclase/HAMP domain-containing protein
MIYSKIFGSVPLRIAIVVPFLLQITAVVGIIGWLSFRTGQQSVNILTNNLSSQISDNIAQQVQNHLNPPQLIEQLTTSAISTGNLDIEDFSKLERFFWSQVKQQPPGTTFQFGNERGEFIGVRKEQSGLILLVLDKAKNAQRETYILDNQGKRSRLIKREKYDPRTRPWYKAAVKAGKPTWTPLYPAFSERALLMASVTPIYNDAGKLQGVLSFEIALSQISQFLQSLSISKSGEAFIVERSGTIVASSATQVPIITEGRLQKRLKAIQSRNPLIKATAQHLLEKFDNFQNINIKDHLSLNFVANKNTQLVHVAPIQDRWGINWLVIVVIPQSDFMEHIIANRRINIVLSLVSLSLAILFGLQTSKWIVKPILGLNTAAKKLSEGQWEQKLPVDRDDEIGQLAKSFAYMTEQLKESFDTLEDKVKIRTAELALANDDLEKKNELIRKVFGRYLTNEVVANLLENPEALKLGGERRKITILTSDLRGFTAISEQLPPEEVVKILNAYLHNMADVIGKYYGTIDEFMGDGILVLFGAPTVRKDDAVRAVACAVDMQLAMANVNAKMQEWGLPLLEMGIAINTGEVVVGNIGSETRTKYGIVGSNVNLTYRIESYTVGGQIFISESTFQEAGSIVKIDNQKQIKPKGVNEPLTIYEVGGIRGEYNLFLAKEEEIYLPLIEEISIEYTVLEGKHIGEMMLRGSLTELSAKGAKVKPYNRRSHRVISELINIKINLLIPQNSTNTSRDIYAKVMKEPEADGSFYIHFTAKPPAISVLLENLYRSRI